jgi:beta-glucosidase
MVLRDEPDFNSYIVSDWFVTHLGTRAINAGSDLNLLGYLNETDLTNSRFGSIVVAGIRNGSICEF